MIYNRWHSIHFRSFHKEFHKAFEAMDFKSGRLCRGCSTCPWLVEVKDAKFEEWSTAVETLEYSSETPMGEVTVTSAKSTAVWVGTGRMLTDTIKTY